LAPSEKWTTKKNGGRIAPLVCKGEDEKTNEIRKKLLLKKRTSSLRKKEKEPPSSILDDSGRWHCGKAKSGRRREIREFPARGEER